MNQNQKLRYSRQLLLPGFGIEAQKKLADSSVLVIGAGGLGVPVLQYLAAAGVGQIGIADDDRIELSNLQRQVIYSEADIGERKAEVAARVLQKVNPHIRISVFPFRIQSDNAMDIFKSYELIVDCTDNIPSRYLINDACFFSQKPFVFGSLYQYEGQVSVFNLRLENDSSSPNYRDLFPIPPPPGQIADCSMGGVLATLPPVIGSLMSNECIKVLTGIGAPLTGRLLLYDARQGTVRELQYGEHPENPLRGENPLVTQLIDYNEFCGVDERLLQTIEEITARELKAKMEKNGPLILVDVREKIEFEISSIGGVNIPLDQIESEGAQLSEADEIILICRSGQRSAEAVLQLRELFPDKKIAHLRGGLLAWKDEVAPHFPMY